MNIKTTKILSEGIAIGLAKKINSNNNSSLLDDIDELEKQSDKIISIKNEVEGLHEKALLCRGFVKAVVYKDEEK